MKKSKLRRYQQQGIEMIESQKLPEKEKDYSSGMHDFGESVGRIVAKVVVIRFGLAVVTVLFVIIHFLTKLW